MGRKTLKQDLVHLVANVAVVYFGIAAIQARGEPTFLEQLGDKFVLFYTAMAASVIAGYKTAKRVSYYCEDKRREDRKYLKS